MGAVRAKRTRLHARCNGISFAFGIDDRRTIKESAPAGAGALKVAGYLPESRPKEVTMRNLGFAFAMLAIVLFTGAPVARAQDAQKAELAAGYAFMRDDLGSTSINMNGWFFNGVANVNNWLGLEGEVAGTYGGADQHDHYSVMGGARFAFRGNRATPYAHVLAGGDFIPQTFDETRAFTAAVGGGVDTRLTDRIAWRVQADYRPIFYSGAIVNDARVMTGIVFTFGGNR
jgi:hypothetical protein